MAQPCAHRAKEHTYRQSKNADTVLVGKPEEKRPHWGPRCRWEDDIKTDIKDMNCIIPAQDREQCRHVVNTITNLRVTQNAGNFRTTMPVLRSSQRCSKRFGSSGMWRYVSDVLRIHVNYMFKCGGVKPQTSLVYHASRPSADGYPAFQQRTATATVFTKILTFVLHTEMQTSSNHGRICTQWHLVHRRRWRPVIAATDLRLRLCYFVGMLSRWRARALACARASFVYASKTLLAKPISQTGSSKIATFNDWTKETFCQFTLPTNCICIPNHYDNWTKCSDALNPNEYKENTSVSKF